MCFLICFSYSFTGVKIYGATMKNKVHYKCLIKKIWFTVFLFFTLLYYKGNGQNYTVNVPVYDTIVPPMHINLVFPAPPLCITAQIWIDPLLGNSIQGVSFYLKITTLNLPPNTLIEVNSGDTLNAGDSLLITNTNNEFWFAQGMNTGYLDYAILAVGTPTLVNDSFCCKSDKSGSVTSPPGCVSFTPMYVWLFPVQNCTVEPVLNVNEDIESGAESLIVMPNPFNDHVTISINDKQPFSKLFLFDSTGRLLCHSMEKGAMEQQLNKIEKGVYILQIDFKEYSKKYKVIKQ